MAAMKLLQLALVGTLHLSAAGLTNIEIHATKGEEAWSSSADGRADARGRADVGANAAADFRTDAAARNH
jgi:hypothetical protein